MIGQTLSHYKIIEKLGEGGMGEVYLAEDAKLDRTVALKFLPPGMASAPDVKARFIQEAKAASALKHPNVCTIHDIQEHEGRLSIVMEHVEGATLTEKKGQLSVKKAVDVIAQVAEGLAAAHEKGIVHRDIKADNIMLRDDGIAQIMDFGLAKLRGVSRLTKEGSTVGTTAYMSPEAIQGHDSDHRTDIYSLGVVLFELVTGRLPFDAVHETAVMYEIVNVDAPPPSAVRADLDPELDRIVLECLDKDPDERFQSAKELAKDLRRFNRTSSGRMRASQVSTIKPVYQHTSAVHTAAPPGPAQQSAVQPAAAPPEPQVTAAPARRSKLPWVVAGVSLLAFFLMFASNMGWVNFLVSSTSIPARVTRAHALIPEGGQLASWGGGHLAVSPDGTLLAYVASDSTSPDDYLWVRQLSSLTALKLPGTRGAFYPFWSPDSKQIGFFQDGKMMKIAAAGGPALTICEAANGRLGAWNEANTIVFSPHFRDILLSVSAAGGSPDTLTARDTVAGDATHRWPWFLPDGRHYLHFARAGVGSGNEQDAICVRSLDGTVYKRLVHTSSNVAYAAGHLLYMRSSTLMAHPFDVGSLELTGDAFPIAENVSFNSQYSRGSFSVSTNGILVYQSGEFIEGSLLMTYDREGRVLDTIGDAANYFSFALSPDESRILADIQDVNANQWDIWSLDIARGIKTRLTFASENDGGGKWHPNNEQFAFASLRLGDNWAMYTKAANGVGEPALIYDSPNQSWPTDWSSDGGFLIYTQTDSGRTDSDIWAMPMTGDRTPFPLAQSEFEESEAKLSPDGRWLAYTSEESGNQEVYVAPFPDMGSKWQVSVNQGDRPRWRRDGKELFYLNNEDEIMAAAVDGTGSSFRIGKVTRLFQPEPQRPGNLYQVYGDGQRFIVNTNITPTDISTVTLVVNWDLELPAE